MNIPFYSAKGREIPGPTLGTGVSLKGLERREVEKRIYGVRKERLTASACLSENRILFKFEQRITELETKKGEFMNDSSPHRNRLQARKE